MWLTPACAAWVEHRKVTAPGPASRPRPVSSRIASVRLQAALNSRVIIEQAKGMLSEYLNVTVSDAFELLRTYARTHNRKLSEIASDVVDRAIPSSALTSRPG
jgi:hypothetical protein